MRDTKDEFVGHAVGAIVSHHEATIAAIKAENERLREALGFYSCTEENCECVLGKENSGALYCGFVARAALTKQEG